MHIKPNLYVSRPLYASTDQIQYTYSYTGINRTPEEKCRHTVSISHSLRVSQIGLQRVSIATDPTDLC